MQSIDRSKRRNLKVQDNFVPPYCPNNLCALHCRAQAERQQSWFVRNGFYKRDSFPHKVRRYKCRSCQKGFSKTYFQIDYCQKRVGLNQWIFTLNSVGVSNREIARHLKCSETLVTRRLHTFARWALLKHSYLTKSQLINEPIVYDGLENFSGSQYEINNINHAIGKDTYFIYDFNFAAMNRKGKMSDRQKEVKKLLEKEHGKFPPSMIRTTTETILKRLLGRVPTNRKLDLYSDQHFQYRRALKSSGLKASVNHFTTSSAQPRNYNNPLFAVNHMDLIVRQQAAAFRSETIAFSKRSIAMIYKYALQMTSKNYFRPTFVKAHKRRPLLNQSTPAMLAGVVDRILTFREFFKDRVTASQVCLNTEWRAYYMAIDPFSRRGILPRPSI